MRRKSAVGVSLRRSRVSLCWTSGWLSTVTLGAAPSRIQRAALRLLQLGGGGDLGAEIAGGLLGIHLDARLRRDQLVRDRHALDHLDAAGHDRRVLEVAH